MYRMCVAELVERSLPDRRKRLVSVPDMIYNIRREFPQCEHTDAELAELVAVIAIRRGCNLSFASPGGLGAGPSEPRLPNEPEAARRRQARAPGCTRDRGSAEHAGALTCRGQAVSATG